LGELLDEDFKTPKISKNYKGDPAVIDLSNLLNTSSSEDLNMLDMDEESKSLYLEFVRQRRLAIVTERDQLIREAQERALNERLKSLHMDDKEVTTKNARSFWLTKDKQKIQADEEAAIAAQKAEEEARAEEEANKEANDAAKVVKQAKDLAKKQEIEKIREKQEEEIKKITQIRDEVEREEKQRRKSVLLGARSASASGEVRSVAATRLLFAGGASGDASENGAEIAVVGAFSSRENSPRGSFAIVERPNSRRESNENVKLEDQESTEGSLALSHHGTESEGNELQISKTEEIVSVVVDTPAPPVYAGQDEEVVRREDLTVLSNSPVASPKRSGSVTMQSTGPKYTVIVPTPGFVIKSKKLSNNEKVFINVCHHSTVPPASDEVQTSSGKSSKTTLVVVGAVRETTDKSGDFSMLVDVAINTGRFEECVNETESNALDKVSVVTATFVRASCVYRLYHFKNCVFVVVQSYHSQGWQRNSGRIR
jgi:hypothetical protein